MVRPDRRSRSRSELASRVTLASDPWRRPRPCGWGTPPPVPKLVGIGSPGRGDPFPRCGEGGDGSGRRGAPARCGGGRGRREEELSAR